MFPHRLHAVDTVRLRSECEIQQLSLFRLGSYAVECSRCSDEVESLYLTREHELSRWLKNLMGRRGFV